MSLTILPGSTIGIIGGGQLGRMMAIAAKEMGYKIAVLEPTADGPCAQVSDIEIIAAYSDLEGIKRLAEVSDVITYEFENIHVEALQWLEKHAYLPQGSELLKITRNRYDEKQAITSLQIDVAPYEYVTSKEQFASALSKIGIPSVLKTVTGGYDGKGQVVIRSEDDINAALQLVEEVACVLEAWIPFEKEISVIVGRNVDGEISIFPIAENVHKNQILHTTTVPAYIPEMVREKAIAYSTRIAEHFKLVGVLAIEMFVTETGEVYVNELAPRPHNTGHFTMNACETSQFNQHIRGICNVSLGETTLLKPVVMVNILGQHMEGVLQAFPTVQHAHLHLYGKEVCKVDRKMGHMNVLCEETEEAHKQIKSLNIWGTFHDVII